MKTSTATFIISNVVGIFVYAFSVYRIRQFMALEQRTAPDFGDGLNFLSSGFPVLVILALYTLAFGIYSAANKNHEGLKSVMLVVATWLGIILVERSLCVQSLQTSLTITSKGIVKRNAFTNPCCRRYAQSCSEWRNNG